jgi:RNase P subunit RPR2
MSLVCPNCHKELVVPSYAYGNVDAYDSTVHVTTECCGTIVTMYQVRTYKVSKSHKRDVDDWGVPATGTTISIASRA